jgi:hypothetical protein
LHDGKSNAFLPLLTTLGNTRQKSKALSYGSYRELLLTNRQYAFSRTLGDETVLITVNNDDNEAHITIPAGNCAEYTGAISGQKAVVSNGCISVTINANSGEIWLP